ncbi:MAG: non-homologous end-joining DNA ligase [Gemmatimonadaceae bacterium]
MPSIPVSPSTPVTRYASGAGDETEPMYASIGHDVPRGRDWTFEPKYDGVRVLAHVDERGVRLITRNGNDKARQFPEVVVALAELGVRVGRRFVIDGEIVALVDGTPARFQSLQGRVHLKGTSDIAEQTAQMPAAIMVFDILRDGADWVVEEPWTARRAHLKALLDAGAPSSSRRGSPADPVALHLRLSPSLRAKGELMLDRAREQGWEGVIAKRVDIPYHPGVRSDYWLKLKIEFEQEFVVGGFTEPRKTREHIGALLLGYFNDSGKLVYVGHTGGGFTRAGLANMRRRLDRIVRKTSPFETPPHTNEPATWVRPGLVVQVKFSEWTDDGKLRQPIYLGIRDDKAAREVDKEAVSVQRERVRRSPSL